MLLNTNIYHFKVNYHSHHNGRLLIQPINVLNPLPYDLLTRHLPKFSVVFHWYVTSLFDFKRWIDGQFFTNSLTVSFGPSDTPWVLLLLECSVAFRATKFKYLKIDVFKYKSCHKYQSRK